MNKSIPWERITASVDLMGMSRPSCYAQRFGSYQKRDGVICIECLDGAGKTFPIELSCVSPDVIRIRAAASSLYAPSTELIPGVRDAEGCHVNLKELKDELVISTGTVTIHVEKDPFCIRMEDARTQKTFFSQAVTDLCYGFMFETTPLGFEQVDGQWTTRESIRIGPDEQFYGLGETFGPIDKKQNEFRIWCSDAGGTSGSRTYKSMPFLISSQGYGLLVNTSCPTLFRMGTDSHAAYSFYSPEGQIDYLVIRGQEYGSILKSYCGLTGFAPMPPKWSFGHWISRCMYMSQDEVLTVARKMREHRIPCDVISIDPYWMGEAPWCSLEWDRKAFPDPEGMIQELNELGIRLCLWITPYVAEGTSLFDEGREKGYFLRDTSGAIARVQEDFGAAGGRLIAGIDFTDEEQVSWWLGRLRSLLTMGVSVFKTDFGEQCPVDILCKDGRTGLEMHNLYPLLFNKAVYELVKETNGIGITWGRSGYIGSQRYPLQWGGDSYASYPGFHGQLRGLLSYGLSGVPFCSHDIGGFDYEPVHFRHLDVFDMQAESLRESTPDTDLYLRWMQFGCFSSHARSHGKRRHEPWEYGPQAEQVARKFLSLRYSLLPYLYTASYQATQTALPVVRPMLLSFPEDRQCRTLDTQYMFGDALLVAPVFDPAGDVDVYLPEGRWFDYWTKESLEGPKWIHRVCTSDSLPLYVREGSVIPYAAPADRIEDSPWSIDRVEIYGLRSLEYQIMDERGGECVLSSSVKLTERGGRYEILCEGFGGPVQILMVEQDILLSGSSQTELEQTAENQYELQVEQNDSLLLSRRER